VRAEILQKFGKAGDPNYEQLEQLDLLNACFLETLRLYPSAGFMRRARNRVTIAGYDIPAYAEILFLPYLLHRDEQYWERATEFVPERFLDMGFDPAAQAKDGVVNARMDSLQSRIGRISKDKVYFPFSLGPRNCVGRPLALAEMRVVAIKLLQRFSFRTTEDKDFAETPLLTLTLNPKSIRLVPVVMESEL
jgi:cytochrome P450